MNCTSITGKPCKCRRLTGHCIRCTREMTVSAGEHAEPIAHNDKGQLVNYTCFRCRGR